MLKIRLTDTLLIILSFALLIFHTFTYMQNHYSFYVTVAVFVVILLLYVIRGSGVLNRAEVMCILPCAAVLFFMVMFVEKETPIRILGQFMPYAIWTWIFFIMRDVLDDKMKRTYLILFSAVLVVSNIASLTVLLTDSDASRQLAGAASATYRRIYYAKGVGGYGFIYGNVFLLFSYLCWLEKEKSKVLQVLLIALMALSCVTVFFASYTTAILMLMIVAVLFANTHMKKKTGPIFLAIALLLIFLLRDPILEFIMNLGERFELYWIVDRISKLIDVDSAEGVTELKRYGLYMKSWNTFLENPFLGGDEVGAHSMLLDTIGKFGSFGVALIASIVYLIHGLKKNFNKSIGLIFVLFVLFMIIDTVDSIMMTPMVFFVLPLMLEMKCDGVGKNKAKLREKASANKK